MSEQHASNQRAAYTFTQFAELFGKDRSWTYRLARNKKISTIKGYGCAMVPASEVQRISEGHNPAPEFVRKRLIKELSDTQTNT